MITTTYTSLEVAKLAAVITGGGYKRSATKEQAVARFLKIAEEAGITDAADLLDAERYGYDAAHHVLVERRNGAAATIPQVQADASLTEDEVAGVEEVDAKLKEAAALIVEHDLPHGAGAAEADALPKIGGRAKKIGEVKGEPAPAAEKAPRPESKTAMLLRLAQSPEGITNAKMKELTGWTKLGGFFNAAKKAGLELTRVRENGDTTWHAAPAKGE